MKTAIIALALCAGLGACQYVKYPSGPNAGNPDHDAYAGSPGSTYDVAANPPRNIGNVTYNPDAPLPPPADPAVTAAPLPPMPAPPMPPAR